MYSVKWRFQRRLLICLLVLLPIQLLANEWTGVQDLIARRVPWLSGKVVFEKIHRKEDAFSLRSESGKIVIGATGPNAAAVGLNWYLKYYCHRSMSHMGDNLAAVKPLPQIKHKLEVNSIARYRYALNYCTYNYTMSFYSWKDWEHELDWMALNGVNTMLVATGAEAVWQNTLRRLGYSSKEIADFITGPAYTAWWLMGNIENWGGPMPQSQITSRKELTQKMISRMRTLGIEPVLPGFFGMVPVSLKQKLQANYIVQGTWGAFVRPDILNPTDTLFARIAGLFYEETRKLYGREIHFFSGDPFHEGGTSAGVDLARAGAGIQQAMQQYFHGSIWVLQGWQDNPKKELLAGFDKSKVLVQELFGENTNNWETRNGYEGTPFIWCAVNNFGERPGLQGKLERFATEVPRAAASSCGQWMKGVGIMPEGINNNPVTYELLLETAWHQQPLDPKLWVEQYATARYGKSHADISKAWQLLLQTAYANPGYQEGPPENILCARPALQINSVSRWGSLKKGYDTALFAAAVHHFEAAAPAFIKSRTYKIDLINFKRQLLSNRADQVYARMVAAYQQQQVPAFEAAAGAFLQLADQTDSLLDMDPFYRLETWRQQALDAGNTKAEKKNNLLNALMLITYWGENNPKEDNLHEYSYREWSGLMKDFYKGRWVIYINELRKQLHGEPVTATDFFQWERNWVRQQMQDNKTAQLSLNGSWNLRLDSGEQKQYKINLPGTLDDAGIGEMNRQSPKLDMATMAHLTRKRNYVGKAYYTRRFRVPDNWSSKQINLVLGRVLWQSTVWIDGQLLEDQGESLVTSQKLDITRLVKPGQTQEITICINNANIYPGINNYAVQYPAAESKEMVHAYTNHTQIKWNGILGGILLEARPPVSLQQVDVYPDLQKKQLSVRYRLNGQYPGATRIRSYVLDPENGKQWPSELLLEGSNLEGAISLPARPVYWNEFQPKLYRLVTILQTASGTDTVQTSFGIRQLQVKQGDLYLNDDRIFLRGNLECAIFPLKGYPPMHVKEWQQLFAKAKAYGLNHLRFHSWCPPEAAFEAADKAGLYLQVELPHWSVKVGEDTASFNFLQREAARMLAAYGNHPSFLFFSMGNELEGNFDLLNTLVARLKQEDPRHLYSTTSFSFQKGMSGVPQPQDEIFITQWTKKGWVRGQGLFNDQAPDFSGDFHQAMEGIDLPLISHEIGQYAVYPDLQEINRYKGNLLPLNFKAVENDLRNKGLLRMAPAFLQASGKLAAILYKEEIERSLRTKGMDGFQLLQLQDFPGQGTALVGMLNAFWENKGFLSAERFRAYCSPLTPLLRFPKAVYCNAESFIAQVELANFYQSMKAEVHWELRDEQKRLLDSGSFSSKEYPIGNGLPVGTIRFDLGHIKEARKLQVTVNVKGTHFQNSWNIWVYPSELPSDNGEVLVTGVWEDALEALQRGRKVLLCPRPDALKGIKGRFVPVFWSPAHFKDQPGTMGLLIKNNHPALKHFPTAFHSDWQWWDLVINSRALVADQIPGKAIIVQPIDNFMRNQQLASLFEVKVGSGKLVVAAMDLVTDLDNRLQARQLHYSLLKYMNSAEFRPTVAVESTVVQQFFK